MLDRVNLHRQKLFVQKVLVAITPKELHHIAQGCSRSELPWVGIITMDVPRRGSVIECHE